MRKRPKPDDRSDNVDRLQEQVVNTIENLEEAYVALAAAMVDANSADVEAFSGATGTSEKAVEAV